MNLMNNINLAVVMKIYHKILFTIVFLIFLQKSLIYLWIIAERKLIIQLPHAINL